MCMHIWISACEVMWCDVMWLTHINIDRLLMWLTHINADALLMWRTHINTDALLMWLTHINIDRPLMWLTDINIDGLLMWLTDINIWMDFWCDSQTSIYRWTFDVTHRHQYMDGLYKCLDPKYTHICIHTRMGVDIFTYICMGDMYIYIHINHTYMIRIYWYGSFLIDMGLFWYRSLLTAFSFVCLFYWYGFFPLI